MTALTAEYSRQTAEFFHQTSTLTAENHNLNRRLESIESVGTNRCRLTDWFCLESILPKSIASHDDEDRI